MQQACRSSEPKVIECLDFESSACQAAALGVCSKRSFLFGWSKMPADR